MPHSTHFRSTQIGRPRRGNKSSPHFRCCAYAHPFSHLLPRRGRVARTRIPKGKQIGDLCGTVAYKSFPEGDEICNTFFPEGDATHLRCARPICFPHLRCCAYAHPFGERLHVRATPKVLCLRPLRGSQVRAREGDATCTGEC